MTTTIINPPPFVERFQYKNCKQINDPVTRKRVYQTPDGETLPSVTTILSATKDMTELNKWRDRIGHEKAQQITTEAANRGTRMHAYLEQYILLINDFSWYVLHEKEIAQWAENCLESFTIEGIILKFVSAEDRSLFMLKWI